MSKNLQVFTDGSSDPLTKRGGIGMVVVDAETGKKLAERGEGLAQATSNQAEIIAVHQGLLLACERGPEELLPLPETVIVYTDSLNAIGWLTKAFTCSPGLYDCLFAAWSDIDSLKEKGVKIGIEKCPGHAGVMWNEMAHHLAGEGRKNAPGGGTVWL